MKSTIFFKNTTPELILAFLFSASVSIILRLAEIICIIIINYSVTNEENTPNNMGKGPFKILVIFFLVFTITTIYFLSGSFEYCTDCLYHCQD